MTSPRPKVLRVYHSAVVSGWRQREVELHRQGLDVTTVSPRQWNEGGHDVELVPAPSEPVVGVRTFGRHPFRFFYDPLALWNVLRRSRPDVIDIHEEPASLAAFEVLILARLSACKAPFCLYSAENITKIYPLPFRWIERFLLRRAAAVHSCNDEVTGILRAKGFSGPVCNLGLGVDVERFAPSPDGKSTQTRLHASTDTLHVGFVGRIDERKGVLDFLTAIEELRNVSVTYVGSGSAEQQLRNQITAHHLADRVTIRGFVSHDALPSLYREFDVVVVPSLDTPTSSEQFGRVAIEAMASGVPVVVSTSGSLAEVVGNAGIVVPQGDIAALTSAIRTLADSETCRTTYADAGANRAQEYAWSAVASRQSSLYQYMYNDEISSADVIACGTVQ